VSLHPRTFAVAAVHVPRSPTTRAPSAVPLRILSSDERAERGAIWAIFWTS
jgi:hypothetical protein